MESTSIHGFFPLVSLLIPAGRLHSCWMLSPSCCLEEEEEPVGDGCGRMSWCSSGDEANANLSRNVFSSSLKEIGEESLNHSGLLGFHSNVVLWSRSRELVRRWRSRFCFLQGLVSSSADPGGAEPQKVPTKQPPGRFDECHHSTMDNSRHPCTCVCVCESC